MTKSIESDLTADEYVLKFTPRFIEIPLNYNQTLLDLESEASSLAARYGLETARYGLENEKRAYPPWVWDRVFGD